MNKKTRLLFFCASIWILGNLLILSEDTSSIVFAYAFDMSKQMIDTQNVEFSSDGTKLFVLKNAGYDINIYACNVGFDILTCVYSDTTKQFLVPPQFSSFDQDIRLAFYTDGKKYFTIKSVDDILDVSENSSDPIQTKKITGTYKYEGLIEVTQTEKYSDIWVAKDGREFEMNEYNSFKQINQSFERHIDTDALKTRSHSEFYRLVEYEVNRAQMLLEQLCKHCTDEAYGEINDIFAYEFPKQFAKKNDPKIQASLISEELRAKQILDDLFDPVYSSLDVME